MPFYVYIMASKRNGTLYTGHTDNLPQRVMEHREKRRPGFTSRYNVTRLVWFDQFGDRNSAFISERRIKEWRRIWKIEMIEAMNPDWDDLYDRLDELLIFWDAEGKLASAWVPAFAGMSGQLSGG
jgi:putative endonuclease